MKTLESFQVPTGHILVVQGERGKLECLSIGDYGKDVNIKCDALGLSREPSPVKHVPLLPLEEKWVITVSTQYGCSMGCHFCDVPKVGPGINATYNDLLGQVSAAMTLHPEVRRSNRLNLHYARMGEPTWNPNIIEATKTLHLGLGNSFALHPVISTMMPKRNQWLPTFLNAWMQIKNDFLHGEAGLQISTNSTSDEERFKMFNDNALSLADISSMMFGLKPKGRKITLNFAIAGYEIDPKKLLRYFPPDDYLIKLTPMHKTHSALSNEIKTDGDYTAFHPYQEHEEQLKRAGYDVLVFIASEDEDLSRITCGNAVLSGSKPEITV